MPINYRVMKRRAMLYLPLFVVAVIFVSVASVTSKKPKEHKVSIVGKWRVTSDSPNDIKNHTYEFFADGTCIEKFRACEMLGPIDEPPQAVWVDEVFTYKYKPLGNNRYRLQEIKSMVGTMPGGLA